MADASVIRSVGKTSVQVNALGLGTGSLGFLYEPVSTEEATLTIHAAYDSGIHFFDTAAMYGGGLAEERLGRCLSKYPRDAITVATKVGYVVPDRTPETPQKIERVQNFSYDGVIRSFESSLKRLNLDSVDIVHIHDPDHHEREAVEGAYRAVCELRSQGIVKAIGVGMNSSAMLARFADRYDFDCFLLAGRYTLLDQGALADLMPIAVEKQISVFVGGPLNSGILADPYSETPMFNYRPADKVWIEKARRLDEICRRHEVPLKAAALQFPLAHPAVASVLIGPRSRKELMESVDMLKFSIPGELWTACKREGLIPDEAPTPCENFFLEEEQHV